MWLFFLNLRKFFFPIDSPLYTSQFSYLNKTITTMAKSKKILTNMEYRSSHCLCLKLFTFVLFWCCLASLSLASIHSHRHSRHDELDKHPLSKINIYKTTLALRNSVSIKASPLILGFKVYNTVLPLVIVQKQWSFILDEGWTTYVSLTMKSVLHVRGGNYTSELCKYYPL